MALNLDEIGEQCEEMPRHSKNNTASAAFTYHEKRAASHGTVRTRVGTDSQLPFGHCCLCLQPVNQCVVSPSGHAYCRECILEYILARTKEIKRQLQLYEADQARIREEQEAKRKSEQEEQVQRFAAAHEGVQALVQREEKISSEEEFRREQESKADFRDREAKRAELKAVAFWIPEFTPEAKESAVPPPPKRPPSPMSGQPLRAKDLVAVDLIEDTQAGGSGPKRYICPVTRDQITSQKVIVLKTNGKYMLESAARDLAYPTMTCPLTGERFKMSDVIELQEAATGFAASGQVEAKRYKPSMT